MTSSSSAAAMRRHADTDAEIGACLGVMKELRPHLGEVTAFVEQIRRQMAAGYRLLAFWRGDRVIACAGYRVQENLIRGRHLYVDDLVTTADERSRGHGERLFEALIAEACAQDCGWLVLDSGVTLAKAHRFYFRQRMTITAFRFALPLN